MTASAGEPGAQTGPGIFTRAVRAFRALTRDERWSALAALALWITMFLPWYSEHAVSGKSLSGTSLSAWSAFGLVQVVILLLSLGTLAALFLRGERRALGGALGESHALVAATGSASAVVVLWGMFDRPGGALVAASGIEWGIAIALLAALWLASTGIAPLRTARGRSTAIAPAPSERRLTRRERSGGGEVPDGARWVEPGRARAEEPPARPPAPGRPPENRRSDATQLSLELPHDHYDE